MNKDELKRTSNEAPLSEVIDKLLRAYRLDGKMKELDIVPHYGFLCHAG